MQLKLDTSIPYAIALEGGGAKGAYQIGAWKALSEAGVKYNAVSGTSVGALNGAMMAMRDLDSGVRFWKNVRFSEVMNVNDTLMKHVFDGDWKRINMRELFHTAVDTVRQGGFDVEPLKVLLREAIDEKTVMDSDVAFFVMTYSVSDHKELDVDVKSLEPGELYDMLLASAYFPAFKHEKLNGKMYTDGGVQDVVPIHSLTSRGYKDLIVMRIYGFGVERHFKMPKDVNMHTIAPNRELGNVLNFSSEQSQRDMQIGYYDAKRMLYGLSGKQYYIDRTFDEATAYERLQGLMRYRDESATLREINENLLPALSRKLDAKEGDYFDLLVALMEKAADELKLEPFRIVTDEDFLAEICRNVSAISRDQRGDCSLYFPPAK